MIKLIENLEKNVDGGWAGHKKLNYVKDKVFAKKPLR